MKKRKIVMVLLVFLLAGCGGQVPPGTRPPITIEPGERVAEYDAAEAIRSYASRVLGMAVEVKMASGRTGTITLPGEAQKSVDAAVTLAGTTYNGILADGLASVSLGDGKISGDLTADIESASLGVFVMTRERTLPANEAAALALIKSTFPGIAALDYVARPQQGKGRSFQATTTTQAFDPGSRQYVAVSQSALVTVTPGLRAGRVLVWAVVANGTLTKALTF